MQCLAPFRGMETSIASENDPVKDNNRRVGWWQVGSMGGHPNGHLVCDHVVAIGHSFEILEHAHNSDDIVCSARLWQGRPLIHEEVSSCSDIVFDSVGLYHGAQDGVSLDE